MMADLTSIALKSWNDTSYTHPQLSNVQAWNFAAIKYPQKGMHNCPLNVTVHSKLILHREIRLRIAKMLHTGQTKRQTEHIHAFLVALHAVSTYNFTRFTMLLGVVTHSVTICTLYISDRPTLWQWYDKIQTYNTNIQIYFLMARLAQKIKTESSEQTQCYEIITKKRPKLDKLSSVELNIQAHNY